MSQVHVRRLSVAVAARPPGRLSRVRHHHAMLDTMTQWFAATPRRLVRAGFTAFMAGGAAMFLAVLGRLGGDDVAALALRYPDLPTWFVPEGPAGYTAASVMVCWGVWAMGSGLRLAREAGTRRR